MKFNKIIWSNKHGTTEHEFEKPVGIWEALTLASISRRDNKSCPDQSVPGSPGGPVDVID